MALIPEQVRQQLKDRFETVLTGRVHLTLYTRPGSSRLILPAGVGCPTCQDVPEVPTIALASDSETGRIRFQGLPTGTEFPALIDAVERVSRAEPGLSEDSLAALAKLTEPTEVMVFATPT